MGRVARSSFTRLASAPTSTWGAVSMRTMVQTPRSNIQSGTSSQRSDIEPPILQRNMSEPARSTTS